MNTKRHGVLAADDLADGETRSVAAGAWAILLLRSGGRFHAINDRCSHAAAHLAGGRLRGEIVTCPLHGARFDVATGRCVGGPYAPIRIFPVTIVEGRVLVDVPDRAPDMTERAIAVKL